MEYLHDVSRIEYIAREYWFELLIAVLGIAGMLELVVGRDSPGAPTTTLWFSLPAVAVLVLPLFAVGGFPSPPRRPTGSWPRRSRSSTDC